MPGASRLASPHQWTPGSRIKPCLSSKEWSKKTSNTNFWSPQACIYTCTQVPIQMCTYTCEWTYKHIYVHDTQRHLWKTKVNHIGINFGFTHGFRWMSFRNSSVSLQNSRKFTNSYVLNEMLAFLNPEATYDINLDPSNQRNRNSSQMSG